MGLGQSPESVFPEIWDTYYRFVYRGKEYHMSTANSKSQTARQIWLLYFNRVLLERGMITEREHNQMKIKICAQTAGGKKNQV